MNYVTNEETGVSGVEPVNLGEDVLIIQDAFPGTLEALIAEIKKDIASGELPEATGTYQRSGLIWQVYKGETQITDIGPINVLLLMGLASDDEASYFVALVALPDSYGENSAKFDSVFYHTLYAFSPHP